MSILQQIKKIASSYLFIITVALGLGLFFPNQTKFLSPYVNLLLGAMFFFIALEVNLKEVSHYLKNSLKMIAVVIVFMLIIFPLATYYLMRLIYPELAISFMLIAAMPTAMAAALLAEVIGGKPSLALVLTVTTALLAPFTIPLVIRFTAATEVATDFMGVFWSLVQIIFIPFILANIVKYLATDQVEKSKKYLSSLSLIFLGLLMTGIVANQAAVILSGLGGKILIYLMALFALFIGFQIFGYLIIFWRSHQDRVTVAVCLTYMNIATAIYLAYQFFNEANIVVPTILAVIPWTLTVIPFKYVMKRIGHQR